ncbi:MAG: peptidoglycan-binding protein [Haliscomenobacteraceae bacterium CHB4]|nr:peptidoglycan-binding protein [Haliscomenobacteraceae bacterium CHB4]
MNSISLGSYDSGAMPADKAQFLSLYHASLSDQLKKKLQFRDEGNGVWRDFRESPGSTIRELQQFLKDAGFMPKANVDGVFGYATQAAVRLFQEYLRTVERDASIGAPDGIVGPNTLKKMEEWKQRKAANGDFVSEWGRSGAQNPSPEFGRWLGMLARAKEFYTGNPNPILAHIEQFKQPTDTRKVGAWDTSPDTIHLIGIRANETNSDEKRRNDDLFVLLIRGMVFKFWGSTDPNPDLAERADIPFLVESQHHYQFGWHKVGDETTVYRALRPASSGVLVFRDKNRDRKLTEEDVVKGLDPSPNSTINIHWSGIGSYNFSAGCQVIAGKSYINHQGKLIDCTPHAATSYKELGGSKGRGAYNVFADLVLTYAPPGVHTIAYMLGRDETLTRFDPESQDFVANTVSRMQGGRMA